MTTRTSRYATFGLILLLALFLPASPALAQKGKGGGGGGGGGSGGSGLPANANLAYNTTGDKIVLMDTTTGEVGTLVTDGAGPAWSHDGSQIAYFSNNGWDIAITDADGSGPVQYVTTVTDRMRLGGRLDWSRSPTPSGSRMLLYADRDNSTPDPLIWSIYAIGSDGTGKVELIHDDCAYWEDPRWSPDGNRFLYTSWNPYAHPTQTLVCTVGMVDVGTPNERLAVVQTEPLPITGYERDWSNNGHWIVVRASGNDLWMIDASDFQNYYQLTSTPNETERWPTFDAPGSRIYFMINEDQDRLYSIAVPSGGDLRLESGRKGIFKPQCRRD